MLKQTLLFTLWAGAFAGLITLKDYTDEEINMKAREAQCRSTTMNKAMATQAYSTPAREILESPNTVNQRKARENFYRIIGQGQGLHVSF